MASSLAVSSSPPTAEGPAANAGAASCARRRQKGKRDRPEVRNEENKRRRAPTEPLAKRPYERQQSEHGTHFFLRIKSPLHMDACVKPRRPLASEPSLLRHSSLTRPRSRRSPRPIVDSCDVDGCCPLSRSSGRETTSDDGRRTRDHELVVLVLYGGEGPMATRSVTADRFSRGVRAHPLRFQPRRARDQSPFPRPYGWRG